MKITSFIQKIILILLVSLTVGSCNLKKKETTNCFSDIEVILDNDTQKLKFTITIDESKILNLEEIECFGLLIRYGSYSSTTNMREEVSGVFNITIKKEEISNFQFEIYFDEELESNYTNSITVRPYFTKLNEEIEEVEDSSEVIETNTNIIYGTNIKSFKIVTLATDLESDVAKKILDANKIIYYININFDKENYIASTSENSFYTVDIKKPLDYKHVYFNIDVVEDYIFYTDFKIYLNGEELTTGVTLSEDNKQIEYVMKDPNWTPIF